MNLFASSIIENKPILTILLVPLISSLSSFLIRKSQLIREVILMLGSLIFAYAVYIVIRLSKEGNINYKLISFGNSLSIAFNIESIGLIFLTIVGALWFFSNIYSIGYLSATNDAHQSRFFGFLSLSIFCTVSLALSSNIFTLFLSYELLTLVTYPLVIHNQSEKARQAGREYIYYLLGASTFLLLPAVVILQDYNPDLTFSQSRSFLSLPSKSLILLISLFLVYGTAKTALFPLHGWLPKAMSAPMPVSALLHSVTIVKGGIFTLIKVFVYVFGIETIESIIGNLAFNVNWLTYMSAISMIYASLKAIRQDNIKSLLAYSTIAQLSTCLLALSILTQGGVMSCILHVFTHAFTKITLFFIAGALYIQYGKDTFSGCNLLYKKNLLLSFSFAIAGFSLIGLPPFLGFWSKYYIIIAAWEAKNWLVIAAMLFSTSLTASYIIPAIYKFFWTKEKTEFHENQLSLKNRMYLYIPLIFTAIMSLLGTIFIPYIIELLENNFLNLR